MVIQDALNRILAGESLQASEMRETMMSIMQGECSPAQIGGFLVALRMKGETVEEIAAAAGVMRELSTRVLIDLPHLVDVVGTGGDGSSTFNVSTTSAFVVAAAGGNVAKHNNRSVSSSSGSADVLDAAGIKLDLNPEQVIRCVKEVGIGFMFAPMHHGAMKHAAGPRKELGARTLFNLLGPLTNPASAPNMLMGVFADHWLEPLAQVLNKLGLRHVMVVHSEDGMDEISIAAPTRVAELKNSEVRSYSIKPADLGIEPGNVADITVANPAESLQMMQAVLANQAGTARDIVRLNAGAAIYTAGLVDDLESGVELATEHIEDGSARDKLEKLVALSQSME